MNIKSILYVCLSIYIIFCSLGFLYDDVPNIKHNVPNIKNNSTLSIEISQFMTVIIILLLYTICMIKSKQNTSKPLSAIISITLSKGLDFVSLHTLIHKDLNKKVVLNRIIIFIITMIYPSLVTYSMFKRYDNFNKNKFAVFLMIIRFFLHPILIQIFFKKIEKSFNNIHTTMDIFIKSLVFTLISSILYYLIVRIPNMEFLDEIKMDQISLDIVFITSMATLVLGSATSPKLKRTISLKRKIVDYETQIGFYGDFYKQLEYLSFLISIVLLAWVCYKTIQNSFDKSKNKIVSMNSMICFLISWSITVALDKASPVLRSQVFSNKLNNLVKKCELKNQDEK